MSNLMLMVDVTPQSALTASLMVVWRHSHPACMLDSSHCHHQE